VSRWQQEVVEDWQGDTYRAIYSVGFNHAVYVLHCFQKKATRGIATPEPALDLIKKRLTAAEHTHGELYHDGDGGRQR